MNLNYVHALFFTATITLFDLAYMTAKSFTTHLLLRIIHNS